MEYYLIAVLCITLLPGALKAMRPSYKPITFYTAYGNAITGELALYDEFRNYHTTSIAGIAPECLKYTGNKWKLKTAPMPGTKPIIFEVAETGEKLIGEHGVAEYYLQNGPFLLSVGADDREIMEKRVFCDEYARRPLKTEYCLGKFFPAINYRKEY